MVYKDRLEADLMHSATHTPKNFRIVFYNFCYYFWGQHCCWIETSIIGNDFFVFWIFHCLQLFYCPPALSLFRHPWKIPDVGVKAKLSEFKYLMLGWKRSFQNLNRFRWNCCNTSKNSYILQVRYEPHLSDKLIVLKRPGFQSRKYGMPSFTGTSIYVAR